MSTDYYVHPTAMLDEGCIVGAGSRIWHFCHLMPGARIGARCILGQNVFIADGVTLGNGVKVQNNVSLYAGVRCEDEVFIGPSAVFTNVRNPRALIERKREYRPTLLRKGSTIGAKATSVCGITIGEYAFIGAGAVVTRDVPDYALVMGNPAAQVGWVSKNGLRLHFDESGLGICPESGEEYVLEGDIVRKLDS
ncbi:MAG: N-acetyltransferase [Saprospiraceae bacterium]|nr:N-acetyltransferase [Saprospiraceae bacterium]